MKALTDWLTQVRALAADQGQARVATRADGTLVGIRKPLAAHEQPIVRSHLAVEDIQQAVKKAEDASRPCALSIDSHRARDQQPPPLTVIGYRTPLRPISATM
jgi:glutamate formiminotransferase